MFEMHGTLIMISSEIRHASEGLNVHRLIIVASRYFGGTQDVNRRQWIVKSIFEVTEVRIAIIA